MDQYYHWLWLMLLTSFNFGVITIITNQTEDINFQLVWEQNKIWAEFPSRGTVGKHFNKCANVNK